MHTDTLYSGSYPAPMPMMGNPPRVEYTQYPPLAAASPPPQPPLPQLSSLGSVNAGKLPGPSQPPHGPAIPAPVPHQGGF